MYSDRDRQLTVSNSTVFSLNSNVGKYKPFHIALWSRFRMKWTLLLIFFLWMGLFVVGLAPIVRFVEEEITITVESDRIAVDGIYWYRNPWPFPVIQGVSVPFPVDEHQSQPLAVQAEQLNMHHQKIPIRYWWGRHRFDVHLPANSMIGVRVSYQQYCRRFHGRYILNTTRPWLMKLQQARYRLILKEVTITQSNYPMHFIAADQYEFTRANFMPHQDWEFAWEKKL